ncbi:MAG: zinc ABC transporter solute-binding protein [Bacteroidetes bacterium]|nr:zinc ABC transporter solute-binding protein [Bacteroidota bacterium]
MKISTITVILALLSTSCTQQPKSSPEKPQVSVSILPQKYFIEQLAGDRIDVNVMVPPGASPATYEPSVSQLSRLDRSSVYMKMGYLGFEHSWMDKIRSVNPSMEVISLSDGLELIHGGSDNDHQDHNHHHGGVDPHIWMSARNAKEMASTIADALCRMLPDDSVKITDQLVELRAGLDSLDREIGKILAGAEGRSFMIYHPSLSYFARDYQLEQLSLEWEGKSPSPSHMKRLTDEGKAHNISTIFIQVEFDRKNAEILSKEIGAEIATINPLDYDWQGQMMYIAAKLNEAW